MACSKRMAKVFDVGVPEISKHLRNIFDEEELNENMVVSKMENTTKHLNEFLKKKN